MTAARKTKSNSAATLLELMVSMVIVGAILILVASMIEVSARNLVKVEETADEKSNVRKAMTALTRNLSQAALNSYWDYNDPVRPTLFQRQSELHFVSGAADRLLSGSRQVTGHAVFFQAPFGYGGSEAGNLGGGEDFDELQDSLNCWGYFIEYGSDMDSDRPLRPDFLRNEVALHPARNRFRLMEFRLASEKMNLFGRSFSGGTTLGQQSSEDGVRGWFQRTEVLVPNSGPIAENIVALVLRPRAPQRFERDNDLAPKYYYDTRRHQYEGSGGLAAISRHQLPPMMDLTMVAVSEDSYARVESTNPKIADELIAVVSKLFQEASRTKEDVLKLEEFLIENKLSYRTLSTSIAIPAAKWVTSTERDPTGA
ncbi:MAG: hypothetical protein ACI8UO_002323 [Verrucomicrobiales bacterium]|jgi:uncharacterized protein (TIGR02599 family)